jgi:hypothetical protein
MIDYQSWPAIPSLLVDDFIRSLKSRELIHTYDHHAPDLSSIIWEESIGKPLEETTKDGLTPASFIFEEASANLKNWIREHIPLYETYSIHVQVMCNGNNIFPHIDEDRKIAYNYIIESHPDTITCFYKPTDEFKNFIAFPNTYIPYDRVNLIVQEHIEMFKWHKLDVKKIHSVEKLDPSGYRIAITLSIPV